MAGEGKAYAAGLVLTVFAGCMIASALAETPALPAFGRDTVLVYRTQNQDDTTEFVVRIAEFLPDRYVEWENSTTQGTIFMPGRAIAGAKIFVTASLFEGGVDTKGKDKTTLWLSQRIYRELKEKNRAKVSLDGIDGWLTLEGSDQITVEVNRSPIALPVIRVKDDRGSERAFLDQEDNPLIIRHSVRRYCETLASITTDKTNTLRWIKGRKLTNPR